MSDLNIPKNRLLAALPQQVYQRLLPHLQLIKLSQYQILYLLGETCDFAYFPCDSIISSLVEKASILFPNILCML